MPPLLSYSLRPKSTSRIILSAIFSKIYMQFNIYL
nr:MAG TPA: hypothetical protein [Caudoviricetes sp.]